MPAIETCRRVSVDLAAVPGAHLTLWQPGLRLASDKETVIQSGLTRLNILPSSEGSMTVYARCSRDGVEISNGDTVGGEPSDEAFSGWVEFEDFDPSYPVKVT